MKSFDPCSILVPFVLLPSLVLGLAAPRAQAQSCFAGTELSSLASSTPGTAGLAELVASGDPIVGQTVNAQVVGGLPGALGGMFYSETENPTVLGPFGALFVPSGQIGILPFTLDASGSSPVFPFTVPAGFCTRSVTLQAAFLDPVAQGGVAFTNAQRYAFGTFNVASISVSKGEVHEINREIEVTLNQDLDFSSVSLNTVRIERADGAVATGSFFLRDARTLVFQPTCPLEPDLSDAGLSPASSYTVSILGSASGASNVLRSTQGNLLGMNLVRSFFTPSSPNPAVVFFDTTPGAPVPVLRAQGSTDAGATHVQVGSDPVQRVFFELDPMQNVVLSDPSFQAPLNLHGDPTTQVTFEVHFNQPIDPSPANLGPDRVRLEALTSGGAFEPIPAEAELVANCTGTGAIVRLRPTAILPQGCDVRVVVLPGFRDIVGEANVLTIDSFASVPVRTPAFATLTPADGQGDEVLADFLFGGASPFSLEDTEAVFDVPAAEWGDGELRSAYEFDGTGGLAGDFDWVVPSGTTFLFDTTLTSIVGGPDGVPTTMLNAVNGVVDVNDLIIEEGAEIRFQGPNPVQIKATGDVIIRGTIDVSGFRGNDVATLNTGNVVEIGGAGGPGAGRGGNGSEVVTSSTPGGGTGQGAFGLAGAGGRGGESQFAPAALGKDARRPGGGGGGRFASDATLAVEEAASAGFPGSPQGTGAISGLSQAEGGGVGSGVFVDGDDTNDFFGNRLILDAKGTPVERIAGELAALGAGAGGGGGGDALPSAVFPTPAWTPGSDEKGGPGGGGGGSIHIRALGRIVFGPLGEIRANGMRGGTGENTLFLDHVGGTGGSGSGGHVVLESATQIDFTDGDPLNAPVRDYVQAIGGPLFRGPLAGVPLGISHGGAGGAGVVQLHVPDVIDPIGADLTADIVIPTAALGSMDPVDEVTSPRGYVLLPTIGARSKARSRWVALGGADKDDSGTPDLVRFLFRGTDPAAGAGEGLVETTGNQVTDLPPLLAGAVDTPPTGNVTAEPLAFSLRGTDLDPLTLGTTNGVPNDLYLRSPALLKGFTLRLESDVQPLFFREYPVVGASYEESPEPLLRLEVDPALGTFNVTNFLENNPQSSYSLTPRFFRVRTQAVDDLLVDTSSVRVLFQAAGADAQGNPDAANPLVDWTGDVSTFNALPPGALQFFRFEVEFDLDAQGTGLTRTTDPVSLDFLRVPFLF